MASKRAGASYTSTAASIGLYLKTPDPDPANLSETERTVNYRPFVLADPEDPVSIKRPCTCNLTADTCDGLCCCDPDCEEVSRMTKYLNEVCRQQHKIGPIRASVRTSRAPRLADPLCHLAATETA